MQVVATVIDQGALTFDLAIPCEVFGLDRSDDGLPRYDFALCGVRPGLVPTTAGFARRATRVASPGLRRSRVDRNAH